MTVRMQHSLALWDNALTLATEATPSRLTTNRAGMIITLPASGEVISTSWAQAVGSSVAERLARKRRTDPSAVFPHALEWAAKQGFIRAEGAEWVRDPHSAASTIRVVQA